MTATAVLNDSLLNAVSGGEYYSMILYPSEEAIQWTFKEGDIVEVRWGFNITIQCRIVGTTAFSYYSFNGKQYYESYDVVPVESKWWHFESATVSLDQIEK